MHNEKKFFRPQESLFDMYRYDLTMTNKAMKISELRSVHNIMMESPSHSVDSSLRNMKTLCFRELFVTRCKNATNRNVRIESKVYPCVSLRCNERQREHDATQASLYYNTVNWALHSMMISILLRFVFTNYQKIYNIVLSIPVVYSTPPARI